jgi:hypothetical protein
MHVGETVVFVSNVQDGVEAGKHGRVMGVCDDTLMVGCRVRERLAYVLVHTWDVLPEPLWRRLLRRRQMASEKEVVALVSHNVIPTRGKLEGQIF